MSGALSVVTFAQRLRVLPFVAAYGRKVSYAKSGTTVQTASSSASLSINTANTVTVSNGLGTASNPAGFSDPAGVAWYAGVLSVPVWLYYNRTSETLDTGAEGNGTVSTSAGGVWVNAMAADQAVTASASVVNVTVGSTLNVSAAATYAVYAIKTAIQPVGGPQGVLLGNVRVECFVAATRT